MNSHYGLWPVGPLGDFGSFGRVGKEGEFCGGGDVDCKGNLICAPSSPDKPLDYVCQDPAKKKGAEYGTQVLGLFGKGFDLYSSLQERMGLQAKADAVIAKYQSQGQISANEAQAARDQVSLQLGLAESKERQKANFQKTVLILGVGALIVGGGIVALITLAK